MKDRALYLLPFVDAVLLLQLSCLLLGKTLSRLEPFFLIPGLSVLLS